MNWLYLVIIAQLISAVVYMIDKFIVSPRGLGRPAAYAFYVGILSSVVILMLPFVKITLPDLKLTVLSLAVALSYILSLVLMYSALKIANASDVAPAVGAVTAISTVIFSGFLLSSDLPVHFLRGFPLLILGTFLMSALRFPTRATIYILLAGIFFGLSSVFTKMIFLHTPFLNGFFWSRIANVIGALLLLLWPGNLKTIFGSITKAKRTTSFWILTNKVLAGVAFLLTLLAISLGDVSTVNSLSGIQFIFILIFAFVLTYKLPQYFHEDVHQVSNRWKKIAASALIIVGFIVMFI